MVTRTHLGRVTPLGQLRSLYKSNVERCFLEFWVEMAKWPWWSRSMTSIFNISWDNTKVHTWYKFDDSSSKSLQGIVWTIQISKNSEPQWPKWPWSWRSMISIFNSSWDYPMMHVWCKFGDFSSNLLDELSCGHAKVYGETDRRTDRQMQATTIPIWPERSRGKNIYYVSYIKREMCVWLYCTIRWVSHFSWVEWASMLWWWPHECSWWSIRQYLSAFMTWGIVRLN